MKDNLFVVLGIQSREDCISNALAYAFNASCEFRKHFLNTICGKSSERYESLNAYTRISAGTSGIPDMVLVLENTSCTDIVVLENKLKAEEGQDQTIRYMSKESITAISNRLLPGKKIGDSTFVFLSLFPDQEPSAGNEYIVKRHFDLTHVVADVKNWDNAMAKQLMTSWIALIDRFYSFQHVSPDDVFFEKLVDNDGLDGGYLYFRSALSKLVFPNDLALEDFFRSSAQGRRFYGVKITKDSWHPGEMVESEDSCELDPFRHFNIHFEPQYNALSGVFSCFLHYEVNPYQTEAWVRRYVPQKQYDAYLARRSTFAAALAAKGLTGWNFGGGSNQLAKATFDFSKSSYAVVKSTLEEALSKASQAIDSTLLEMPSREAS